MKRSTIQADGWYRVSDMMWPVISGKLPDELVDERKNDDGGFIRFTAQGEIVAKYL
jgi:hypothetical protein